MSEKVKVIPLGGLGTIGKNITVIEYKNDIENRILVFTYK